MTGLLIFFSIYITLILSGVYVVWYFMNNYDEIIFKKK